MSDVHQQGSSMATVAGSGIDPLAWTSDVFAPFNMAWQLAPAKAPIARVLGKTPDEQALIDVTIRRDKVVAASAVVPIKPEYTPMLVFLLAVLVESATREEADRWLARGLAALRKDRPSEVTRPWHQWRVELATNVLGLLMMQVR